MKTWGSHSRKRVLREDSRNRESNHRGLRVGTLEVSWFESGKGQFLVCGREPSVYSMKLREGNFPRDIQTLVVVLVNACSAKKTEIRIGHRVSAALTSRDRGGPKVMESIIRVQIEDKYYLDFKNGP